MLSGVLDGGPTSIETALVDRVMFTGWGLQNPNMTRSNNAVSIAAGSTSTTPDQHQASIGPTSVFSGCT